MNKYLLMLLISTSLALQACDKGDSGSRVERVGVISEISITNLEESNLDIISEVAFVARVHAISQTAERTVNANRASDYRYMLRIPFNKNGMSFTLPQSPPKELLKNITNDIPQGFDISDPTANTISFVEIGCCAQGSDNILGQLVYRKQIGKVYYRLTYIYCDSSVKITGTAKDWWGHPATYDLSLEKGWNMVVERREYSSSEQILTVSNSLPYGMSWTYDKWY